MLKVCMTNKPIRISKKVLEELKWQRDKAKLKSYDAVLEKLLRQDKKKLKGILDDNN